MAVISLEERSKINHKLKQLGFGGINDPNLFAQIATLFTSHDSFRGLLLSTKPDQRRIAYESIKPHLGFVAKPLDQYEREIHEKAEREQWDVVDPGNPHWPRPFKVGEVESEEYRLNRQAQEAIAQTAHEKHGGLELVCSKCTLAEVFQAAKRKDAEKEAHTAGWRWAERNGAMKTYCPKDVPARCIMTISCSECPREEKISCWEPEDGYLKARLSGWLIEEAAKCFICAAKPLPVQ